MGIAVPGDVIFSYTNDHGSKCVPANRMLVPQDLQTEVDMQTGD